MNKKIPKLIELSSLYIAQNYHPEETQAIKENFYFASEDAEFLIQNIPINLALINSVEENACESFWNHIIKKCSSFVCYKARIEKLENIFLTDFNYECLECKTLWKKKQKILINMLFHEALHKISNKRMSQIPLHKALGTNCIHSKNHFCLFEWLNLLSGSITKIKLQPDNSEVLVRHKMFLENIRNNCVHLELQFNNSITECSKHFQNILFIIGYMIHNSSKLKSISIPFLLSYTKVRMILVLLIYKFADTTIDHNECCCKLNDQEFQEDFSESYLYEENDFCTSDTNLYLQQQKENKRKINDCGNNDHKPKKLKQDLYTKFEDEIFSDSSSSNARNHLKTVFLEEQKKNLDKRNKEFKKEHLTQSSELVDSDDNSCSLCFPNNMSTGFESQMQLFTKNANLFTFNLLKLQLSVSKDDLNSVIHLVSKLKSLKELNLEVQEFQINTMFNSKKEKHVRKKPIVSVIELISQPECALSKLKLEGFTISVDQFVYLSQELLNLVQCRSYGFELLELNKCDFINGDYRKGTVNCTECIQTDKKKLSKIVQVLSFNNNIIKNQMAFNMVMLTALKYLKPQTLVSFQNKLNFYESSSNMVNIYIITECLNSITDLCSLKNIHIDLSQQVDSNDRKKIVESIKLLGIKLFKVYHPPYPYYSAAYKTAFSPIGCLELEACHFIDFEYSSIIHNHNFQAELATC